MLWLHAIRFEECNGIEHCSENLKYSLHLPSDIIRHSSPDNWCFVFERLVRYYKKNQKNLCKTYADRASQFRFVSSYLDLTSTTRTENDKAFKSDISCPNVLLAETTVTSAIALKEHIDNQEVLSANISEVYKYGIAIGSFNFSSLTTHDILESKLGLDKTTLTSTLHEIG